MWGCLKKAERRYPDNLTIVWKLRFLKQHFSYLMNDPSLLEKGWMAYQQGIMAQLRLQIEFLEKSHHAGTEFAQKLKESRDSENFAQIAVWGKLIDQMSIDVLREQSDDTEWEALKEIMKEFRDGASEDSYTKRGWRYLRQEIRKLPVYGNYTGTDCEGFEYIQQGRKRPTISQQKQVS